MISPWDDGVRFEVKVQPRSSRNELAGFQQGVLKVKLTAPPVEGEANQALISFLAEVLGTGKRNVEILKGETSRLKLVGVHGISPAEAENRLKKFR
ncbi:MAG: YggU family protein [Syntrophomonadaceae bacterium]|nr:YggU family protein [Syntrophomonadaceae bacterium]